MIRKIKKRDGKIVDFNPVRITEAIWKAAQAVGGKDYKKAAELTDKVITILEKELKRSEIPTVEQVQDVVEKVIIEDGHAKTAKAFILYRKQHQDMREIGGLLKDIDVVDDYLSMLDWKVNENSNMAYSLQGLNVYATESIISHYWLNKIYPPEIGDAHTKGDYHLHDLGTLGPYCVGWDLKDLLLLGFKGVSGKIESKPAKHFSTALMHIVNYLYTLQGEAAGAQALSNFDTLLAPFIAKDQLQYDSVKQEMQKFLFNMNVPTRVGFQSPFSNCTMDLTIPGYLAEEPAIIGGNLTDNNYSEYTGEMEMINRAFAENMHDGDSKGRPFTFPIPTYNITKDFNWNNDGLTPLWDMTAKYGIPYFSNFINSDMKPDDARSMCPLAGDEKVLIKSSRGRIVEYSMIRYIYEGNSNQEEYEIYSAGKFIKGKFNKWNDQQMIKIKLENGHEIKMSSHHLNYIMNDSVEKKENVVKGRDLKPGMYLPYSLQEYEGSGGTKDLGYFVGAYAGDGSFDGDTSVVFSLENHYKKKVITKLIKIAEQYFGAHCTITADKKTKLTTVKVHSKAAVGLCKDYVEGIKRNKKYTARIFTASKEFRKGALTGHYDTDGGNRNRIYTSSPQMVETLNMLTATLGTTTSIYEDAREGRLGKEPNYAVLIYQLNRKNYGDIWFKKNNKLWVKIRDIAPISNSAAYCFEVKNGTPVFTVGTTGILTHNCRLRLDNRELRKRGGGLFGANPKTGSIGVVTLNMPRIGYLAKDDTDFFERLDALMVLAKQSLEIKRDLIENLTDSGLHPYSRFYLSDVKKTFGEYWKNHFSTIGLIGMNDALLNFMNKSIADTEGKAFAEKVLDYMRKRIADFQEETENIFNLEATPGEGTSYRLARIDKKQYPDIRTYNQEIYTQNRGRDVEPYYTNSTQLPVGFTTDVFEALDLQDSLQTKYTGGTVLHIFLGEEEPSPTAIKNLVRKVAENYALPYYTITPTFSVCPDHGYIAGEHQYCPTCHAEQKTTECEIYSRVVGYIRPVNQWNKGKQQEFRDRKTFDMREKVLVTQ
jgi:ribonucleoside-triphosphate reductase